MTSNFSKFSQLTGFKKGPSPATIWLQLEYSEELEPFLSYQGFQKVPGGVATYLVKKFVGVDLRPTFVKFQVPVTPPTIEMDFGNSSDSENVARVGEVVLPKYKKAKQFRWSSFLPYDIDAPYLSTRMSGGSWITTFQNTAANISNAFSNITKGPASPQVYIKLFEYLCEKKVPITLSMKYYDGGQLDPIEVTLETFKCDPDTAGDYNYEISFIEYTDITPTILGKEGEPIQDSSWNVMSKVTRGRVANMMDFFNKVKRAYGVVSKKLVWAMCIYSGVRHLTNVADNEIWKIFGSFKKLAPKFGARANLINAHKITPGDTAKINLILKENTYVDASDRLAEFIKSYRN